MTDISQHIAIIGMTCRFPKAKNTDEFWQNLRDGVESVSFFTSEELEAQGIDSVLLNDPNYVKANAVLEDLDLFDASFFDLTPREAEVTDPQHRLFLECAAEVLESSGYNPDTYVGKIGVYAGAGMSSYLLHNLLSNPDISQTVSSFQLLMGSNKDFMPTRVSYKLNLKGPSVNVSTACSTSLVAVHIACQSLLDYHSDMALAGGVGIQVPQKQGYLYQESGISSPDGHCRAFDAKAKGTVSGNGVGIVVLKRLEDALLDGDAIHAVIIGSAVNNDGAAKVGYTAPSVEGQTQVIAEAQAVAQVAPETISYIETHGTGTALGDPIEIEALTQAFRLHTPKNCFCAIGSVKSNLGHLDEAAGIAGLIKTVLALKHRQIPPSLHFEQPNPEIDFANSPFFVNHTLSDWKADGTTPRRAGVSSFGIGGTNAHVVVEEAPPLNESSSSRSWQLLVLSAKTRSALDTATTQLAAYFKQHPNASIADVAYTLQVGRQVFNHKRLVLCQTVEDAVLALEQSLTSGKEGGVFTGYHEPKERPIAFMFSGQGTQYVNMGLELYQTEPTFRKQIDIGAEILKPHLKLDLRQLWYPNNTEDKESVSQQLEQTAIAQPALFVIEYALAQLWISYGINPQAMIGHSIGEYVAACLAGVFSLEDALALVAARGQLMQQMPHGAMLAVPLSPNKVQPLLENGLDIAAVNEPNRCVISGSIEAINRFEKTLTNQEIECRRLHTSHAFHSDMMTPIVESFVQHVKRVRLQPPKIPYISNVTGTWITPEQATEPNYYAQHLRQTVRFADGIQQLLSEPNRILLEVGAGRTLTTFAQRHPDKKDEQVVLSSIRHPQDKQSDVAFLLTTLGKLWLAGVKIDWARFYANEQRHRLPLPTYPFERQRYWIESPKQLQKTTSFSKTTSKESLALSDKKPDIADWFYIPSWKRSLLPQTSEVLKTSEVSNWLLFIDECHLGTQLAQRLQQAGQPITTVQVGAAFTQLGENTFSLNPENAEDYQTLFRELHAREKMPKTIVHLWNVTTRTETGIKMVDIEAVDKAQYLGFYSLLFLTQALSNQNVTDKLSIVIVSNDMLEVTGFDRVCPEKATSLGPIKVIQQEYPNISCQSIDVIIPLAGIGPDYPLVDQLFAEMTTPSTDLVTAYRGNHRWAQTFESVRLEETVKGTSQLRENGVYLITGGLGGIGLILAEYLARTWKAKLVLIGRSGLPPREEWAQWLSNNATHNQTVPIENNFNLAEEAQVISEIEENLTKQLDIKGINHYAGFEASANELCACYIYDYLKANNVNTATGQIYSRTALREQLKIVPVFEKFYNFFLKILSDDAIIKLTENQIEFLKQPNDIKDSILLSKEVREKYPEFAGILGLLEHCVNHYSAALSGEIEAISVLYPEGSAHLLEDAGKNTVSYSHREIYNLLLKEIISRLIRHQSPNKKLRILEVGVGDGILAKLIAPDLRNQNVEYYVTDIGRTFVIKIEKEAPKVGFNFMKFGILDISKDPIAQGYEQNSFDLIFGLDVVHATKNIGETLGHLKKLLVPNGLLSIIETVKSFRWIDMIWGLAEGGWYFEDAEIRKTSPLLSLEQWEAALKSFDTVQAFPQSIEKRLKTDYGLIIAQRFYSDVQKIKPSEVMNLQETNIHNYEKQLVTSKIRGVQKLDNLGAEVLIMSADVANEEQMATVIAQTYQRFGQLHGVIHGAGITSGEVIFNLIHDTDKTKAESLFRPKIYGTYVLEKVLRGKELDFCLLISSNAATLGGLGLSAYSASSLFLDAFAISRNNPNGHIPWISTNWDSWPIEEITKWDSKFKTSIDKYGMTREESESAFERVVSRATGQMVISAGDLMARLQVWIRDLTSQHFRQTEIGPQAAEVEISNRNDLSTSFHARPQLQTDYVAPRNEIEQKLITIWQELLGIDKIGIYDNFFDLMGDSLLGTQLISKINQVFQVAFSLRKLFEDPTVVGFAGYLETKSLDVTQQQPVSIKPIPWQEHYELSHGQKRLWVLSQQEGGSVAYNLSYSVLLKGELDRKAFEGAFAELVQRHESLRTTFITISGQPRQKIHPNIDDYIDFIDLTNEAQAIVAAKNLVREAANKPYNLETGPLLRISLLKLADKQHVLFIGMHHIISDGWSLSLIFREFSKTYNAIHKGKHHSLPILGIHYKDYAGWQNRLLESEAMAVHRDYWLNKLSDEIPILDLPTDFPRPPIQTFNGDIVSITLSSEQTKKLKAFNLTQGVSLFMTLVASIKVLLYHYTGQEDIIVGSPIAGRNHIDLENQIGFYLNNLALRDQVKRDTTFEKFLQQVKLTVVEGFEHQIYPFDKLVNELGLQRDLSHSPLFDVMVNLLLKGESFHLELESLSVSSFMDESAITVFDLNFMIGETADSIQIGIEYNTDLFKRDTVQKLGTDYVMLLETVINQPSLLIKDLRSLFTSAEESKEKTDFIKSTMELSEDF